MAWVERLDEARADAPDMPRYRARKDRKRWCRGKVGVEHVPKVVMSKTWVYVLTRDGKERGCRWLSMNYWHPEKHQRYACYHERRCTQCGKVLKEGLGRDCPTFKPRIK